MFTHLYVNCCSWILHQSSPDSAVCGTWLSSEPALPDINDNVLLPHVIASSTSPTSTDCVSGSFQTFLNLTVYMPLSFNVFGNESTSGNHFSNHFSAECGDNYNDWNRSVVSGVTVI